MPENYKIHCDDCGAEFTEIYPDGLDGEASHSGPNDPKRRGCASQYAILARVQAEVCPALWR
jgi:hypothetical protein